MDIMLKAKKIKTKVEPTPGALLELYKQNAEFVRAHLEWRHKLISIYFLSSGGIFLGAKWLLECQTLALRYLAFFPFVVGAVFCYALYEMNNVNRAVMESAYFIGQRIEERLGGGGGIFSSMNKRVQNKDNLTYSKVLMRLFRWSAIAYVGLAILAFVGALFFLGIKIAPFISLLGSFDLTPEN
jgi:hypothetical protein